MDQKRTLWISIASGVFLLVIIGIGIIATKSAATQEKPLPQNEQAADTSSMWFTTEGSDFPQGLASPSDSLTSPKEDNTLTVTDGIEVPEITNAQSSELPTQADSVTVISNGQTNIYSATSTDANGTTTIDLNALKNSSNVSANNTTAQKAIEETNASRSQKINENTPVSEKNTVSAKTNTSASKNKSNSAVKSNASSKNSTSSAAKKSVQTTKKTSTTKTSVTQKTPVQYWVQVSSYTSKKNADEARAELDANKIPCEVFTKTQKGSLYYRVRVGPYTTKDEANYWKERVTSIKMFEKSGAYVTQ